MRDNPSQTKRVNIQQGLRLDSLRFARNIAAAPQTSRAEFNLIVSLLIFSKLYNKRELLITEKMINSVYSKPNDVTAALFPY